MSYAERTSPEILLLEKLEEVDKALPPALWEQMRADVGMAESLERADKTMLPAVRQRKRMFLRDFVEKAVSMPLKIYPDVPPETERQLYRLHLFCCQRAIHCPEVRRNPFQLGFEALREMKTALTGMMISYRLIDPSCPIAGTGSFLKPTSSPTRTPKAAPSSNSTVSRRISFRLPLPKNLLPTGSFIARMTITASVP